MSKTIIDIRISCYKEAPTRIVAICSSTGLVYISGIKPFNEKKDATTKVLDFFLGNKIEKASNTLIVTDLPESVPNWDMVFDEQEHLEEAVSAYHAKEKGGLVGYHKEMKGRYALSSVLQKRKVDFKQGSVWELSTETTNGHICVLVACWVASRVTSSAKFAEQILNEDDMLNKIGDPDDDPNFDMPFSI